MSNVTDQGSVQATWASALLHAPPVPTAGEQAPSTESTTAPRIHYAELPLVSIHPNPRQPRTVFDEDALDELAASMSQIGLLQPVVVRPVETDPVDSPEGTNPVTRYELVAGERRFRSAQHLGWDTIPAMVRPTDDSDLLRDALLENVQRAALNPLEEAAAYQQLLADFGCTQEELAHRLGRSRPQIANTIRLLRLPAAVQRRVAAGVLSQGHARALLALPDEQAMEALATRIVAEGLSVRMVEEIVTVGEQPTKARRRVPRPSAEGDDLMDMAESLGDHLDTRVSLSMGRSKGRMTIEFAGREDLDRILDILKRGGTAT